MRVLEIVRGMIKPFGQSNGGPSPHTGVGGGFDVAQRRAQPLGDGRLQRLGLVELQSKLFERGHELLPLVSHAGTLQVFNEMFAIAIRPHMRRPFFPHGRRR